MSGQSLFGGDPPGFLHLQTADAVHADRAYGIHPCAPWPSAPSATITFRSDSLSGDLRPQLHEDGKSAGPDVTCKKRVCSLPTSSRAGVLCCTVKQIREHVH